MEEECTLSCKSVEFDYHLWQLNFLIGQLVKGLGGYIAILLVLFRVGHFYFKHQVYSLSRFISCCFPEILLLFKIIEIYFLCFVFYILLSVGISVWKLSLKSMCSKNLRIWFLVYSGIWKERLANGKLIGVCNDVSF